MSEFIAEAQVLIRPDTTKFRAELVAGVLAASKGVVVPITVTPVVTGGGAQASLVAQTAATSDLNQEKKKLIETERQGVETSKASAKAAAAQARSLGQLEKGAIAAAAGMTGLRGAVLAASAPFLIGTIAAVAFGKSIQAASDLEASLNVFRVTAQATGDEMERVSETAKNLGRDLTLPGVTAQDAADTFLTLSKAGLSVQESLDGARGTLQLAVAAEISFADAAQLTASALNAFALQGNQAVEVADLLTNAANSSQASIADMGIALRQSAAIADLAGFSLSETVTFLTQLAKAGLAGSDAGTSFRVSIQRLIAPTTAAQKELDKLNINLRDAQGNLRAEAFFELGQALEQMGRATADAARQTIFGNDASRAAAFFARISAAAFRDQEKELQRQGSAAEVAGARNAGFAGHVENLKNQVTALGIELGELSIGPVGLAAQGAALFFGALATNLRETRKAWADQAAEIGEVVDVLGLLSKESGFTQFAKDVSDGASLIVDDTENAANAINNVFRSVFGLGSSSDSTEPKVKKLANTEQQFARDARLASDAADEHQRSLEALAATAAATTTAIARLGGQIAGLQEGELRARISGDQGAEFDLLEQERTRLQRLLAIQENIVAQGGTGAATARRKIREEILPRLESVNNEISQIMQEQVTESKSLADAAKRARDERDRNILNALGAREGRLQNQVIRAEATEALKDDLQANIALRNFYRNSIIEIRKTVRDAQARAAAIAAATTDLIRATQDVAASRQALKDALRQERQEERDRTRESLALDVQIAQATGNQGREIDAREAEIRNIQALIRQTRRGSLQRKRLILELRQKQKELREIRNEQQKANVQQKSLFFEFLQTQQGFAANLLGNLIPGFATKGLVGGSTPAAGGEGLRQVAGGFEQPRGALSSQAALSSSRERGVRPVQVDTTNHLLRQILRSLQNLNGRASHPEARYQNRVAGSNMDTIGGV